MGYAVGGTCFADLISAGDAACASTPMSTTVLPDGSIKTVLCANANATQLHWQVLSRNGTTGAQTTGEFWTARLYPPCNEQQYVDAGLQILGALLTAWAGWYCAKWLYDYFNGYINWSRGDDK